LNSIDWKRSDSTGNKAFKAILYSLEFPELIDKICLEIDLNLSLDDIQRVREEPTAAARESPDQKGNKVLVQLRQFLLHFLVEGEIDGKGDRFSQNCDSQTAEITPETFCLVNLFYY
jgi:hypothetical protein